MADLTPDLQVCLSWGLIAKSFQSLQSLSFSCFHVTLGLPGPHFHSTCMSKAVFTAPLERSVCPYHQSLLFFRMRSRSLMPSCTSNSLDLVVQCLAAWHCRSVWSLPCHFAADAGGLALSMAKSPWVYTVISGLSIPILRIITVKLIKVLSNYPRGFRRKSGDIVILPVRPSIHTSVCNVTPLLLGHLS